MLDEALKTIREDVDNYLKLKMRDNQEQYVKLVPVAGTDSDSSVIGNTICMSLVRIENNGMNMAQDVPRQTVGSKVYIYPPPIKLNLYVLFSAAYSDAQEKYYIEALKRLSHVISFFQSKPVFNAQNTPKLDVEYGDILVEIVNEGIEQQNYLWGMMGSHYRPSVLYRFHSFFVQEQQVVGMHEPAGDPKIQLGKINGEKINDEV